MLYPIWILGAAFNTLIITVILISTAVVFCAGKGAKTGKVVKDTTSEKSRRKKSRAKKSATSPNNTKNKSPKGKNIGGNGGDANGGADGNKGSDESNGTTEDKAAGGTKVDENNKSTPKSMGMQTVPDTLRQKSVDEGGKSCCKGKDGKDGTVEDESHKPNNDKCSKGCSSVNNSTVQKTMNSHLANPAGADDGGYDNIGPSAAGAPPPPP